MKFASLGSGSSGNATLVSDGGCTLLVDCGFAVKETERRLGRLGLSAEALSAILVTHEHSDHIKGVAALSRKYDIPVFMTEGTYKSRDFGRISRLHIIRNYQCFDIGNIAVYPVVVPHDAREPAQFVFEQAQGLRFGVLTDLGSITPHVLEAYAACHGMLVEANHDLEMLSRGPYPPSLKSRVAGAWGHLNNAQTAEFLECIDLCLLQELVVGHVSRQNNSIEHVKTQLSGVLPRAKSVHFACQDEGFDWLTLKI